jgi:hypothetical protein
LERNLFLESTGVPATVIIPHYQKKTDFLRPRRTNANYFFEANAQLHQLGNARHAIGGP